MVPGSACICEMLMPQDRSPLVYLPGGDGWALGVSYHHWYIIMQLIKNQHSCIRCSRSHPWTEPASPLQLDHLDLEPLGWTPNAGMLRKAVEKDLSPWLTEPPWFPLGGEGL